MQKILFFLQNIDIQNELSEAQVKLDAKQQEIDDLKQDVEKFRQQVEKYTLKVENLVDLNEKLESQVCSYDWHISPCLKFFSDQFELNDCYSDIALLIYECYSCLVYEE